MGRLVGKKALVTGAASGIGRVTAALLAREGAQVALSDLNLGGAEEAASEINRQGAGKAIALAHDVTKQDDWESVLAQAAKAFGGLSILVNNAGISIKGSVEDLSFEQWKKVQSVDLDSVFLGCKFALPYLRASAPAAIVNISSIAGIIAGHNMAAYNAAKAGVLLLSKSVALHCARKGMDVRCNSVHPTFIDTPILKSTFDRVGEAEGRAKLARQIPLGRIGEPSDVAYAVLYLASDESRFVTGAELKVDGGISAM